MPQFRFARALILTTLLLFSLLVIGVFTSVIIGQQQPPTTSFMVLQLDVCELPCWVGIVPGETTLGEARQRVEEAYSRSPLYYIVSTGEFAFWVNYLPAGYSARVWLFSDNGDKSESSLVQRIYLLPDFHHDPGHPIIPELSGALGDVGEMRATIWFNTASLAVFFRDQGVIAFVDRLRCDRVLLSQEINSIVIEANPIGSEYTWLSRLEPWRGFGVCHNLELGVQ
jgi:hypothetical protein